MTGIPRAAIPSRWRRPLNLALAGLLALGVIGLVAGLVSEDRSRSETIEALTADIARMKASLGDRADARQAVQNRGSGPGPGILAADSESATARIQAVVRGLGAEIGAFDAQVDGLRVLPPRSDEHAIAIRVAIALRVPMSHVFDAVNALESSRPGILLDDIRISPAPPADRDQARQSPGTEAVMALAVEARMYAPRATRSGEDKHRSAEAGRKPAPDDP